MDDLTHTVSIHTRLGPAKMCAKAVPPARAFRGADGRPGLRNIERSLVSKSNLSVSSMVVLFSSRCEVDGCASGGVGRAISGVHYLEGEQTRRGRVDVLTQLGIKVGVGNGVLVTDQVVMSASISVADRIPGVEIVGVVEVVCEIFLLICKSTDSVCFGCLEVLVDLSAGIAIFGLIFAPAIGLPSVTVQVQVLIPSILPEVVVLLDADLASDGCSGRLAIIDGGGSITIHLGEIGDDLSEVAAGGGVIAERGADSVGLLFVFGAVDGVNVQRFEGAEQAEHAGDLGRLAAGILLVLLTDTLPHRFGPVEVVLEVVADGSALVLVAHIEVAVLILAQSISDLTELLVKTSSTGVICIPVLAVCAKESLWTLVSIARWSIEALSGEQVEESVVL